MSKSTDEKITSGGCQCGAVRYEVEGPLRDVVSCHCTECTRLNGNFGPHSKAPRSRIHITRESGLAWYQITAKARRAFCRECGSGLFWAHADQDGWGIVAGSLDQPTGLKTIGHIFVAEKSDFYDITDDVPQFERSSDGQLEGDYVQA
jgi:hypothetical protein